MILKPQHVSEGSFWCQAFGVAGKEGANIQMKKTVLTTMHCKSVSQDMCSRALVVARLGNRMMTGQEKPSKGDFR